MERIYEIVHESDNEETGNPTQWVTEVNSDEYGRFIWISKDETKKNS